MALSLDELAYFCFTSRNQKPVFDLCGWAEVSLVWQNIHQSVTVLPIQATQDICNKVHSYSSIATWVLLIGLMEIRAYFIVLRKQLNQPILNKLKSRIELWMQELTFSDVTLYKRSMGFALGGNMLWNICCVFTLKQVNNCGSGFEIFDFEVTFFFAQTWSILFLIS